jgi:hypothetical protein
MLPRSVRNANPGNIVKGEPWQGLQPVDHMTPEQNAEGRFAVFSEPKWGFRALAILLRNYTSHLGFDTPRKIITRYAPSSENDTQAYIRAFAKGLGIDPDAFVDMKRRQNSFNGCKAIAIHETGAWEPYWHDEDLADGLDLAGF